MMTKPSLFETWLSSLQASGYRLTAPRRALVEIMASSERALSPVELYDRGRLEHPGLGLVTVYRTLEKLEQLGLVQRVHLPDGCHRYLRANQGHEHLLLCVHCGCAVSFEGDDLDTLMDGISYRTGFTIYDHWLQLYGQCSHCREM